MSDTGVHNIASLSEFKDSTSSDTLTVVDAFAVWCGPCKQIAPKIVEMSQTYPDVKFIKFDVDEVPDLAQELGVRAMPTFFFVKKGEVVETVIGASPAAIKAAVEKHK